jgi:hypothetical protein
MNINSDTYFCELCNKKYKSYQSLWNHNKKFHNDIEKIKKEKEYECIKCNKSFENRYKKYYHEQKCQVVATVDPSTNIITNTTNSNNVTNNTTNNNTNTITNSTVNSNNTIIINNYKNDNLEYVSEKFKTNLFNYLLNNSEHKIPLPHLLENIKFNPNHKENHNVKIKSDRAKVGFYYDKQKWKAVNKDDLLEDLCDYSLKIMTKYFEEMEEQLSDKLKSKFHEFSHFAQLKSKLRQTIKGKIESIAYIFTLNNDNELDV